MSLSGRKNRIMASHTSGKNRIMASHTSGKSKRNMMIEQFFPSPKTKKASPNPSTELPTKSVSPLNKALTKTPVLDIGEISQSRSTKSTPQKVASSLSSLSTPMVKSKIQLQNKKAQKKEDFKPVQKVNATAAGEVQKVKKKRKQNRFKTKLQLKYEDNDNAIKLTANTLQAGLGKFKNPIKDRKQNQTAHSENEEDFDKIFGVKDFARFKESDEEQPEMGIEGTAPKEIQHKVRRKNFKKKKRKLIKVDNFKMVEHQEIKVGEEKIFFPYTPYSQQKEFIDKMYNGLDNGHNCLLESPTGTGKTLSILTSSLGWLFNYQKKKESKHCKIFYASRTHSQIKQLVRELKVTCYNPVIALLGSREQLCVNKELNDDYGYEKNNRCNALVKAKACHYYENLAKIKDKAIETYSRKVMDIEELVSEGLKEDFCSFYFTRQMIKDAHIVFLPYNYLTHKEYRIMLNKYLENSIIIFDEAHNVAQVAEEGYGISYNTTELTKTKDDFIKLKLILTKGGDIDFHRANKIEKDVEKVNKLVKNFSDWISNKVQRNKYYSEAMNGEAIYGIFGSMTKGQGLLNPALGFNLIDTENASKGTKEDGMKEIKKHIRIISNLVKQAQQKTASYNIGLIYVEKWAKAIQRIEKLYQNMLECNEKSSPWHEKMINHYKITITNQLTGFNRWDGQFKFLCLTPSFTFNEIFQQNPRSVIFTSGTLQPMENYETDFGSKFEIKFTCNHVIDIKKQLKVCIVKKLGTDMLLNFTYQNRSNLNLIKRLGDYIHSLAQVTPKGMIIFFPSYKVMDLYYNAWKSSNVLKEISKLKVICKEFKRQRQFKSSFNKFLKSYQTKGALFFAVCCGKLSEGIDFTDEMARMVILVGVPYPNIKDAGIGCKQKYLDEQKAQMNKIMPGNKFMNGSRWYFVQALKSCNQAIGRTIRHRNDFGTIMLLDHRYSSSMYQKELSSWIAARAEVYEQSTQTIHPIKKFFESAEKYCSQFKSKRTSKGANLMNKVKKGNLLFMSQRNQLRDFKAQKREYVSLNKEKELKKTMRNNHYDLQRLREKSKEQRALKARPKITKQEMVHNAMNLIALDGLLSGAVPNQTDKTSKEISKKLSNTFFLPNNKIEDLCNDDSPSHNSKPIDKIVNLSDDPTPRPPTSQSKANDESMAIEVEDREIKDKIDFIGDIKEKFDKKSKDAYIPKEEYDKIECVMCYGNRGKIQAAKCGHLACAECWVAQFKLNKLECPACRKKARAKTLINVKKKPEVICL